MNQTMTVEHETAILVEKFAKAHGISCGLAASFFVFVGVSTLNGSIGSADPEALFSDFLASEGVSTREGE